MTWTTIVFGILIFLIGVIVGFMLDAVEVYYNYSNALDEVYEIGYAQGKEEAEQKKG